jgi:hypothetical protein
VWFNNEYINMRTLLAQTGAGGNVINITPTGFTEPVQNITIGQIIAAAITLILIVAAIVFFFMLIIGGVRWISSGGDKGQTEAARNQITAALIGLVIIFAAWAIVQLLQALFGVDILGNLSFGNVQSF